MIKNIVFDIGKVLMAYDPDSLMERLGFTQEVRNAVNEAMFQHPFWNESDRGALSSQELLAGFISHNPAYEAQIRRAYAAVGDAITLMSHALPWIKDLKSRGYHLYILSNYADYTYQHTEHKMEFLPYMDGVVFSYRCKLIKPETEIYEYLCNTHQLQPSECVFLDDRLENVEAARAYGLHAIQFFDYEQASAELEKLLDNKTSDL